MRLPWRISLEDPTATASAWQRLAAVVVGLVIGGIFLSRQPGVSDVGGTVWDATLGSTLGVTQVIQLATPLILAGCAVAVGLRAGLWNIGVEGQLFMGAWLATLIAFALPHAPGIVIVPLMIVAGFAGGALWALPPALARAYLGVNEVITTLLLNFVAALWLSYWATGPWADSSWGGGGIGSRPVSADAALPQIHIGQVTIGTGFLLAVLLAGGLWVLFRHTLYGFRVGVTGASDRTAAFAGIGARAVRLGVLVISGGIGGLIGVIVELDSIGRYSTSLSNNTGYMGIAVAVLAGGSLLGSVPLGFVMAFIVAAGNALQIDGVSAQVVLLLTGLLLLFAACADVLARYRVGRPDKSDGSSEQAATANGSQSAPTKRVEVTS